MFLSDRYPRLAFGGVALGERNSATHSSGGNMRHILLIEESQLERLGLRALLKDLRPHLVISEANCFGQACQMLRDGPDIDGVIMDIALRNEDGTQAFFSLRRSFPRPAYVLMSGQADGIDAGVADAMGAAAHIYRSDPVESIIDTLRIMVNAGAAPGFSDPNRILASLTPAQINILKGLHKGLPNKQIAYEMGVTENTVRTYLAGMYRRFGVHSRTQVLFLLRDALAAA
jgi:DNA-binding NarL/FixJ family response regulator